MVTLLLSQAVIMAFFILGLVLFLGNHVLRIAVPGLRRSFIERFGIAVWRFGYGVFSILSLALLVYGYGIARQNTGILYNPPAFLTHIMLTLMLLTTIIFVSGFLPAGYIRARTKHPVILSIKIWALAHLMVNGETVSVILFSAFLTWGVLLRISAKRRVRAGEVTLPAYKSWHYDIAAVIIGLAVYAAVIFRLHEWLIGVAPISM